METFHYIVQGRVQGVAFRYYTQKKAIELSISGTVCNLYNGDVEVYAQGRTDKLAKFELFLNHGPSSAIVDNLIKNEAKGNKEYVDFNIIF
jgi:acylphosphatase